MFCTNCGAELSNANTKFCTECGAPLVQNSGEELPQSEASEPAPPTSNVPPAEKPQSGAPGPVPPTGNIPPAGKHQGGAPGPVPPPNRTSEAKPAPDKKLIAIIALAAVAAIAVIALVAVLVAGNKPTSGPQPNTSASSSQQSASSSGSSSDSSGSSADNGLTADWRGFFSGKWVATDSSDERRPEAWFKSMAAEGVYFTLTLWDDGTGVFRTAEGPTKITWDADTMDSATTVIDGEDMTITLKGRNKLTLTNSEGVDVYFVPEGEVDMSNAVDLSQHGLGVTVDPNTIEVGEYLKLIGNESVGYMQVPKNWVNRINDLDSKEASSYAIVYYVDPTSEYVSAEKGGYSFALKVEMSRHSASYKELAQQLYDSYTSDNGYGPASMERMTVGKRRAIVVKSTNLADNVNVIQVVIDRDNDEKVSVVLSYNCGAIGNEKAPEWVMAYTESWQVE